MNFLAGIRAKTVTHFCTGLGISTIAICYSIAVYLGHVPAWLPMISDCAVYPPESYFFRFGMISTAIFLNLNSALMLLYQHNKKSAFGGIRASDYIGLAICTLACIGLGILAAVNEDENTHIHGTAAVIFFVLYEVYMVYIIFRLGFQGGIAELQPAERARVAFSVKIKIAIAIVDGVALVLFAHMSQHWGRYHIQIAISEWIGVLGIILFNSSFCIEFGNDLFLGALLASANDNNNNDNSLVITQLGDQQQQLQQQPASHMAINIAAVRQPPQPQLPTQVPVQVQASAAPVPVQDRHQYSAAAAGPIALVGINAPPMLSSFAQQQQLPPRAVYYPTTLSM
eukprot:GEZU01017328.1.p1 GENE.GEZU01017328.1~~GEZU01017328.1.p1  ORF type:complete len:341 (+),score=95.12 GEZU01017328.1:58-1080(+)